MENKYYVPQIEEFRVGFEYEFVNLEEEYIHNIFEPDEYNLIKDELELGLIRVKYLDSSDIESLGFICILDDVGIQHYRKGNFILETDYDLGSYIDGDFNLYSIVYNPYEGQYNNVFSGIIKNKSELKVLLKQLGIK